MSKWNRSKILSLIKCAQRELPKVGLGWDSGDCANFGIALKSIIGKGDLWGVWESEYELQDGAPAHCALRISGKLYDGTGIIDEYNFYQWGEYGPGEPNPDIIVAEASERTIRQITNEERSKSIESILRKKCDVN